MLRSSQFLKGAKTQLKVEEAARILEKQREEHKAESERQENDIRILDMALSGVKDEVERRVVEMQRDMAVKESARSVFREVRLCESRFT